MTWIIAQVRLLHDFVARPTILTLLIIADIAGYFLGLLYWYGGYIVQTQPPMWAWIFIPDCPLYGLLGGFALLMLTARRYWREAAQQQAQRAMLVGGVISLLLWGSTYLSGVSVGWSQQSALFGMWSWMLLLFGAFFRHAPSWLRGLAAFGNIKYGLWTVTAWLTFWYTTAQAFGAPLFTPDSIFMTLTHLGMIAQGIFLLTYFRPSRMAALGGLVWFGLNDFADYGLGFFPPFPQQWIPMFVMQWSTIAVTLILSSFYLWRGLQEEASAQFNEIGSKPISQLAPNP